VLRVESVENKKVPASKQSALALLLRTADPLDPGTLAITKWGRVSYTLSVPLTPGRATPPLLEDLYIGIMVSLDAGMNLLSEWPRKKD
jgi:hypothetical protein